MFWLNSGALGFFQSGRRQRQSNPARRRHARPNAFSIEMLEMRQLLSAGPAIGVEAAPLQADLTAAPRMAAVLTPTTAAPYFNLPYYDDSGLYSLSADPSRVVVLSFFRTDVRLAAMTLPQIQQVYDWVQTMGHPVTVLGVDSGEAQATVQDYFTNTPLYVPAVLDTDLTVTPTYDIQQFPVTYVIANDQIIYVHTGYSDLLPTQLEAEIQTILDTPLVTITNASVTEGTGADVPMTFTVSLSQPSTSAVNVDYTTVDGSAIAGADYRTTSGMLIFNPGQTTKTISVPIIGDTTRESTKKFAIALSNPVNAILADTAGQGTIIDDDTPPPPAQIYVDDYAGVESAEGPTTFNITIRIAQPAAKPVTVTWATEDDTAIAGTDYVAASGTATIGIGEDHTTVPVIVNSFATDQPEKTFFINLKPPVSDDIIDDQATVTIVDNSHTISVADASVLEGNSGTTDLVFKVSLSSPAAYPVSVDYYTRNDTAIAGLDFIGATGTVTFAANQTEKSIIVKVVGDIVAEPTHLFQLVLRNSHSASVADATATGTILDDGDVAPPVPSVSIDDIQVNEKDQTATFTVTLSVATTEIVSVGYTTADGTALLDKDYTTTTGFATFQPGQTTATITVPLVNDDVNEPDQTFTVTLANPTDCTLDKTIGTATIVDDDPVSAYAWDMAAKESTGVTVDMLYTVCLSRPSEQTLTLNYTTLDGTALAGIDYIAASGTLVFAPGEMSKDIFIPVIGDATPEADKSFTLKLTGVSPLTITTPQLIGTVLDDDRAPRVKLTMGKQVIGMRQTKPPVDFGEVWRGDRGPTRTFKIANTGTDTLRLGRVALPNGFKLVRDLKHFLVPRQSTTFTVRMVTNLVRHYAGHIRISTNAMGNKPYRFGVVGDVVRGMQTQSRARTALSASAAPLAAVAAPKIQGAFASDVKKLIQASRPLF